MLNFYRILETRFEDEIEDEDIIIIGVKDFTLYMKLGVDMAWGAGGIGVTCLAEVKEAHPLPKLEKEDNYIDINGRIHRRPILFDYPYTWYVGPYLTNEELADEWYDTYFNCEWVYNPDAPKLLNQQISFYNKEEFVPHLG
ncbi:MAG: hypothetical protein ACTSRZ_11000 [Promethearchaeota archaeon]